MVQNISYEFEKIRNAFDKVKQDMVFMVKEIDRIKTEKDNEIKLLMKEVEELKINQITNEKNNIYESSTMKNIKEELILA